MGSLPHKDYLWHAEQRQTLHVCATKMGVSSTYVCVCVKWGGEKKKAEWGKKTPSIRSVFCLQGWSLEFFIWLKRAQKTTYTMWKWWSFTLHDCTQCLWLLCHLHEEKVLESDEWCHLHAFVYITLPHMCLEMYRCLVIVLRYGKGKTTDKN